MSCHDNRRSIEEVQADFGDFSSQTIKLLPVDYTQTPIYKTVSHNPDRYAYLDDIDIFSVGHMSDGLFLTGLLVAPKKEGKYPVIVFNRGGNKDLGTLIIATAVNEMAPIAAQGYVVVATNYRGNSRSEGAEQFGGDDVNDVKNLINSMAELDNADISRVGLLGMSRGGMMNFLTIKNEPDTNIIAVINIGGITDLGLTIQYHPQIEDVAKELIPDFEKNRVAEIKKRSAVYWTDLLPKTTPLLMLHSVDDQHVNYSQIPSFVDSLEKNNIPFSLVSFNNDVHGLTNHREMVRKMILDWFDKYVKNSSPVEQTSLRKTVD